jgi:hypothetical protein
MGWRRADGGGGGGGIILIKCHQPFIFTKFFIFIFEFIEKQYRDNIIFTLLQIFV